MATAPQHRETFAVAAPPRSGSATTPLLVVVRRHARLATAVFLAVLAGAATVALSLPDIYRATATVLVEHPGTAEGVGKSLIAGELETRIQTVGQEVLSQARLMTLMESYGLYRELRARGAHAEAVERVRRDIQVKLTRAESATGRPITVAFSITFGARNAETAARVANALAFFYVEENVRILERQVSSARLTRLTQELAQLQEVYTPRYPDVIRLKAELAALERLPRVQVAVGEEFRVLDPAVPAREPVAPQRLSFILFGIGLGLGAALVVVFAAQQFDRPPTESTPRRGRRRLWIAAAPMAAVAFVLVVLVSYHVASDNDQLAVAFSRGAR